MKDVTVYFSRHAETEANLEHIVQSWTDRPLTPHGRAQAESLADALFAACPAVERIVTADNDRSEATAMPALLRLRAQGHNTQLVRMPEFNEISSGTLDGTSSLAQANKDARYKHFFEGAAYPGGESQAQALERLRAGLDRILAEATGERPILVVASAGILKTLPAWHFGWSPEQLISEGLPNATPFRVDFQVAAAGQWGIVSFETPAMVVRAYAPK